MKEIYFAAGCFWATEKLYSQIPGVISATSGYANGNSTNAPTYESVCNGVGKYKETVKVVYDENIVSLKKLVLIFFNVIDPTVKNRQGFDTGVQYQTGIYYLNQKENCKCNCTSSQNKNDSDSENIISSCCNTLQASDLDIINEIADIVKKSAPVFAVEIEPFMNFFDAEEYHQKYLDKVPGGYCHISRDRMNELSLMSETELIKTLKSKKYFI